MQGASTFIRHMYDIGASEGVSESCGTLKQFARCVTKS